MTMDKPDETLPRLNLPLQPPVEPMLAQLTRDMPSGGGWLYAPKANDMDWAPLRPELVCEVAFDHWQDDIPHDRSPEWGGRFRHGTTFLRWRPDEPPEQCTFEQLAFAVPIELEEIFELRGKCLA